PVLGSHPPSFPVAGLFVLFWLLLFISPSPSRARDASEAVNKLNFGFSAHVFSVSYGHKIRDFSINSQLLWRSGQEYRFYS
ncbi:MAG: hypothetical protein ACRD18_09815, partial [Terriglobia bacterium]